MQKPNFGKAAPKVDLWEDRIRKSLELTTAKVAAHISDPSAYPLPSGNASLEKAIYNLYNALPKKKQKDFFTGINSVFNTTEAKRKSRYGDLMNVDFKKSKSIIDQVKGLALPQEQILNDKESKDLTDALTTHLGFRVKAVAKKTTKDDTSKRGLQPRTLTYFIDSVTCNNPVDVRKDEVSIQGFTIDAVQTRADISRFEVGKMKKGETITLNRKIRDFDLRAAGIFPQSFLAGIFIIDKDAFDNKDLADKIIITSGIIAGSVAGLAGAIFEAGCIAGMAGAEPVAAALLLIGLIGFLIAGFIAFVGMVIPLLLLSDLSFIQTDNFIFNFPPAVAIGDKFNRSLAVDIEGNVTKIFKGSYTVNTHWVRTA